MGPRDILDLSPAIVLDVVMDLKEEQMPDLIDDNSVTIDLDEQKEKERRESTPNTKKEDPGTSAEFHESHLRIGSQVIVPFLIAGLAMVGAGLYLDMVQTWPVFVNVSEIIILVPALLGLKGNLEQTLASRLSTEANIGHMDTRTSKIQLIIGNLALVQCQATVVGLLAPILAVLMELILRQKFEIEHALLLAASSVFTASLASLILGFVTSLVIVIAKSCKINPDNVATPIAASLGDITSLVFLAMSASVLYNSIDMILWLGPTIIVIFLLLLPFWTYVAWRNKCAKDVLKNGWTPVIMAMVISTFAGFILDIVVNKYSSVAVFQPLVNGIAGNLVAVQASKMSTQLHRESEMGILPPYLRICISPIKVFFSKLDIAITARVLMFLVIPGHLIFAYVISFVKTHHASLSAVFLTFYLTAVFLQVAILLYLAVVATSFFWIRKKNPDSMTIPYLTALGDLLGVCFLGVTFELLNLLGQADVLN